MPKCNVKLNVKKSKDDDDELEKDDKEENATEKEKEKVTFEEGIVTRDKKKMIEGIKNSVNEDAVATYWMTAEKKGKF